LAQHVSIIDAPRTWLTILRRQLTKSLLKCDFGLTLQLPDDRLCPPVPVRWNYIHWIQELLDTTSPKYSDRYDSDREVIGLDIGVGASCIYSLLACASRPKWRMAGTDIDQHSLEHARKNVEANGFDKRIKLALSTIDGPLLPLDALQVEELDFVMTNPPFYSSADDMMASYGGKTAAPSTVCTGSENELICPGGDFGFVSRIVDESLKLRGEVRWYTAMLGKLSSLQRIVARLKQEDITNFAVTTLQPGRQTKRWAVAWSFGAMRPRNDVSRHGELVHAVLPSPNAQTISCPLLSAQQAGERVHSLIKDLHVNWQWRSSSVTGVMEAKGNVWSRSARRKRKFNQVESGDMDDTSEAVKKDEPAAEEREDEEPVALAVKVSCGEEKIDVRWLRGHDYVLFESFCGLLKRTLAARGRG